MIEKKAAAWAFFDWGNSAISTIIFTFIFPVYFAKSIVGDETLGSAQWSFAIAIAGLLTALCAPLFGGMADYYGPRKKLLALLCSITVITSALLSLAAPQTHWAIPALLLAGMATLFFELGQSVYNAMLNDMAPPSARGRLSGIAWGMGYFGGLSCLVIALFGLVGLGDIPALLPLPQEEQWHIRATCLVAALWMGVFIMPLFLFCPDKPRTEYSLLQSSILGVKEIRSTIRHLWRDKDLRFFLIGSALYRDGLITLFAIGGLYAADKFAMSFTDILIFAIGLNIMSGFGAIALSFLDDKAGPKRTILMALSGLIACGVLILTSVETKQEFMIIALILGIFIGPAQSASRVMMAALSPAKEQTRYFGLYAMTGKAVAFTGPLLYGALTSVTGDQNWGLVAILSLWLVGGLFILPVRNIKTY